MSDFSSEWLEAREVWDHAARATAPTDAALAFARSRAGHARPFRVVDLGAGSGSNHRYLVPRIAAWIDGPQVWRLVDGDASLMSEALGRSSGDTSVTFEGVGADLAHADLPQIIGDADLVTCSALLDLVSESWVQGLIEAAQASGAAILTTLNWDGVFAWEDETDLDREITRHFTADQRSDKGFGPALGPTAPETIGRITTTHRIGGIVEGDSPWQALDASHKGFDILVGFWAGPAIAAGVPGASRRMEVRKASSSPLHVGHRDHFIPPPN